MHKSVTYFERLDTMVLIILLKVAETGLDSNQNFRFNIRRAFSRDCVGIGLSANAPIYQKSH